MEKNSNYELLYIVHPDLESSIDKITDRVRSFIEKRGGKISYEENWGKRKLAYEIKKTEVGIYILWFFNAPKKDIAKIEKDMRLSEEILRYLVLTLPQEKKKPKVAPKKSEKEITEKKKPKEETEEARMKKIDEKLDILLDDKLNKKKSKKEV